MVGKAEVEVVPLSCAPMTIHVVSTAPNPDVNDGGSGAVDVLVATVEATGVPVYVSVVYAQVR